jgi:hypothetical protein
MQIALPQTHDWQQQQQQQDKQRQPKQQPQQQQQQQPEVLDLLLGGKPLLCLAFSNMEVSSSCMSTAPGLAWGGEGRRTEGGVSTGSLQQQLLALHAGWPQCMHSCTA